MVSITFLVIFLWTSTLANVDLVNEYSESSENHTLGDRTSLLCTNKGVPSLKFKISLFYTLMDFGLLLTG